MNRRDTALPGVCVIEPTVFEDERGFFLELYHRDKFESMGIGHTFVQDSFSRSAQGVVRGLHYQLGHPQAKLVRAVSGEIFDVAVDVRWGSETFGKWVGEHLSAANKHSMFIPEGFAHGFYVLSDVAEVHYKSSDHYAPEEERGIFWDDPDVGIEWPLVDGVRTMLTDKDRGLVRLADVARADLPGGAPDAGAPAADPASADPPGANQPTGEA